MNQPSDSMKRAAVQPLLIEGETCWRRVHANRAAVLIDSAEYFAALRSSLLKAQRSVFIMGWELNSRTASRRRTGRPTARRASSASS